MRKIGPGAVVARQVGDENARGVLQRSVPVDGETEGRSVVDRRGALIRDRSDVLAKQMPVSRSGTFDGPASVVVSSGSSVA